MKKVISVVVICFQAKVSRMIFCLLGCAPLLVNAQCGVVINEVFFSPSLMANNSMHNVTTPTVSDSTAEWIELYNPSSCMPADISCWILGSDESSFAGGTNYGIFVFPAGTVIPPLGFLVVGGKAATIKDFDSQTSSSYCGSTRWFLNNQNGWVGLYNPSGAVMDAVYWSMSGPGALTTSGEFANSIDSTASVFSGFPGTKKTYSCACNATSFSNVRASAIPGIEFAGTSSGSLGQGWKRSVDGGSTWVSETPAQATPKAFNGTTAQTLNLTIAGTDPGCGGTGSATATATGGLSPYAYHWSSGQTSASVSGLSGGNYTCTVTDACGCTKTATIAIAAAVSPFTVSVSSASVACFGGTSTATASVNGGSGPFTYSWTTSPIQTSPIATNLNAGNYTVMVSDGTCSATQTLSIAQPAQLTLTPTTAPSICGGSNGSATVTASGGTPAYSYSWLPSGGTNSTAMNLPAGNYTATVTDMNGCSVALPIAVSNTVDLTATISKSPALCTSANGSATVTVTNGAPPLSYQWNTGQQTSVVTSLSAGTYTCQVTDNSGCALTLTVSVPSASVAITSAFTSTPAICTSSNGSANVNPANGQAPFLYAWSNGSSTQTISGIASGTYSVLITDAYGCSGTATGIVQHIRSVLNANFITKPEICANKAGSATVNVSGGTVPYFFNWGDGQNNSHVSGLASGTYSVLVTDQNGCDSTFATSVGHLSNSLQISDVIQNETCNHGNGSISLTINGGVAPYTFSWNTGTVAQNPTGLSSGVYYVTAKDSNGCSATDTFRVDNITYITYTYSVNNDRCDQKKGSVKIQPTSGTAPYSYAWSTGGTTQTITQLPMGTYSVVITDALGCSSTTTLAVNNIDDTFDGYIVGNNHLEQDQATVISANLSGNWTLMYWINTDGDTTSVSSLPLVFPYPDYGTFHVTLYAVSNNGCVTHLDYPIVVEPSWTFYVPDCFSPNDDNLNDTFAPKFTGVSELKGWVYDRWGRMVYEFHINDEGWDGQYKGQKAQEDLYVYKFEFKDLKGVRHEKGGSVNLIH